MAADRQQLLEAYRATRRTSLELSAPLAPEDYRIQPIPDVSPPWWNLGHTSWFFAKNVLEPFGRYGEDDRRLEFVLNSYYEALGPRIPRAERGHLTRPTTDEIHAFRASVDERMEALVAGCGENELEQIAERVRIGIQHEQQHQELFVTEIKNILGHNPGELREAYAEAPPPPSPAAGGEARWVEIEGGLLEFGNLEGGWCWDNELPVHKAWLDDFALASRLVTHGEYLEFIADGGYRNPLLWLSNGYDAVRQQGWEHPLYWSRRDGGWSLWTLTGERPLDPDEPVSHVSFYEADAFAQWKGCRLPTEREWEHAARTGGFDPASGNLLDSGAFHPRPAAGDGPAMAQMAGDLWEWTTNHYEPYPGFRPFDGALTEYNGKFMDNQRVLRGGSCATPRSHIRPSYRNFWPAGTRFQFTGIRLARDRARGAG